MANALNNLFKNAVIYLGISQDIGFAQTTEGIEDTIDSAIYKYIMTQVL